jgi:hypothetical protein
MKTVKTKPDPLIERLHKAAGKERADAAMAAYTKHGSDKHGNSGCLTDEVMIGLTKCAEGVPGYERYKKFFNPTTVQKLTSFEKLGVGIAVAEAAARNIANVPVVKKQQATPVDELIKFPSGRAISRKDFFALTPREQMNWIRNIPSPGAISRADFNTLSPAKQLAFIKEGGRFAP